MGRNPTPGVDSEKPFRVAYEHALQAAGARTVYMASMERQGVPDLYWFGSGHDGWQELKFVDKLPLRTRSGLLGHRLTGQQKLFLCEVCEQGVLGVVAVGMPMALVGSHPAGVIGVSFFFPQEFDDVGQISVAQLAACTRRALLSDGGACLAILARMRSELVSHAARGQRRFWAQGS